jgi:glycosyltransferase involved in cell wall biosynthesis
MTHGEREPLLCITPVAPPMGGVALQTAMLLEAPEISGLFESIIVRSNPPRILENPREGKRISPASIHWSLLLLGKAFRMGLRVKPRVVYVTTSDDLSFLRSMIAAFLAGLGRRTQVVVHHHAQRGGFYTGPPGRGFLRSRCRRACEGLARLLVRRSHAVIQLTEAIDGSYVQRGMPPATAVFPNSVDCCDIREPSGKRRGSILFIGRQSRSKGFMDLLEALADGSLSGLEWTLDVLGDPPTESARLEVAAILRDHPSVERIRFHGTGYGEYKKALLSSSSILALPSHTEVFPVSIVEGMMAGMAVIATPVGEVPDIPAPDGWLPVEPRSTGALSAALCRLLSDPALVRRMGEANREKARIEYDLRIQAARLAVILTQAAETTGREYRPGRTASRRLSGS